MLTGSAAEPMGTMPVKKRTIRARVASAKPKARAK